ncbi:YybH family protein [Mycolicibacterium baixiangningiae]|uniref:YybH family protein n=1 Tax=Mycolicibacterium baixiangningiae TaxID=2761578 RepID=UPI0018D01507|nr:nuclear transport factor 2 family protein [Mycolicibacterium baixiangningiae]
MSNSDNTIETILREATAAVARHDIDGLMAMFHDVPQTFVYDFSPPRRIDLTELRESFTAMTEAAQGPLTCEVVEVATDVLADDIAWTAAIMHVTASMKDESELNITYRATDLWRKIDGRWAVIHEHASMPVNPLTGQADLQSTP